MPPPPHIPIIHQKEMGPKNRIEIPAYSFTYTIRLSGFKENNANNFIKY